MALLDFINQFLENIESLELLFVSWPSLFVNVHSFNVQCVFALYSLSLLLPDFIFNALRRTFKCLEIYIETTVGEYTV